MLISIQYLRIILLLLVVAEHIYPLFNTTLSNVIKNGSLAVSMFFIISGFFSYHFLQKNINNTFKEYLVQLYKSKLKMFLQYYIYLLISFLYLIITHKVTANIAISLILSLIGINIFFENYTINGFIGPAWYFQVLIICFVLLPEINKLINRFSKIIKIQYLLILHFLLNFIFINFTNSGSYLSYYFPVLRIFQFTIGYLMNFCISSKKTAKSGGGKSAIATVIFSVIILAMLHISTINQIKLVLSESLYVLFDYLLLKGLIELETTKKHVVVSNTSINKIVLLICKHSFTVYLFHFIILKYSQLLGNFIIYPMHLLIMIICLVTLSYSFSKLTVPFSN